MSNAALANIFITVWFVFVCGYCAAVMLYQADCKLTWATHMPADEVDSMCHCWSRSIFLPDFLRCGSGE